MTLTLSPKTYATRSAALYHAEKVSKASGVRHRVHKGDDRVFWVVEPTGLYMYKDGR